MLPGSKTVTIGICAAFALATAAAGCGGTTEETGYAPPPKSAVNEPSGTPSYDGPFKATLTAPGHTAKVGKAWPWDVRVTQANGKPLKATASVQFLLAGSVVGRGSTSKFVGKHGSSVRFPARAVGYPLTFRVALITPKGRANLDYPVQVQR